MSKLNIWQNSQLLRLGLAIAFGLALLIGLLLAMGAARPPDVALAQGPTIRYMAPAPTGNDSGNDCITSTTPCATLQHAVDVADPGDEIRVAEGRYTDVQGRPVPVDYPSPPASGTITQVVYISKTVTVRGGYTTTNWITPYPITQPTTLDAQKQGRVLFITGEVSPTIEGLRITDGDAAGLGGASSGDAGGGVYAITATVTLSNSQVFSNTALVGGGLYFQNSDGTRLVDNLISVNSTAQYGSAGGLYFDNSADVVLTGNTISDNEAGPRLRGFATGGGAVFENSPGALLSGNAISGNRATHEGGLGFHYSPTATLIANTISDNVADHLGEGMKNYAGVWFDHSDNATLISNTISGNRSANHCGGACFWASDHAVLTGNTIISNTRGPGWDGYGAGVYLNNSENTSLISNTISNNTGWDIDRLGTILGGGLYIGSNSTAALISNTISSNGATRGGGLYIDSNSIVALTSNTITGNAVYESCGAWCYDPVGSGGGLHLNNSTATLTNTLIADNQAETVGGGLYLENSTATLTNTFVTENRAEIGGSGLYIAGSSPRLLHSTIARNGSTGPVLSIVEGLTAGSGGDGSGVYITGTASTVAMTNTILVSHTVGITVAAGNTATLECTLWGTGAWANDTDWGGAGTIITGTCNYWGDPAFLDPDAGDYHIGPGSAAIDVGVNAGVDHDIDGDPRPMGQGYDIGADEFGHVIYLPIILKDG
jgi:hypothetical protein